MREQLGPLLDGQTVVSSVVFHSLIDSTNLEAKRLAQKGAQDGLLVVADGQTGGRGRRGRAWESAKGQSIYMSLLLRPDIRPDRASMLTLVMGLSVVEAVKKVTGLETGIKWPNDVVSSRRKLAGILTEMGLVGMNIDYIVIGVGINVNTQAFPQDLEDKATSLCKELGKEVDRVELIAAVMDAFGKNYEKFLETQDLSRLKESYEAVLMNKNQPVRVLQPENQYEGTAEGINSLGELMVRKKDGNCEAVYAGEVSVRGLYSYV